MNNNIYTIEDWRRDGSLKVKPGQFIDDNVYYELRDNMPPTTLKRTCFQPGEAYTMSEDYIELFMTFVQKEEGWMYVGLCPEGSTQSIPEFNYGQIKENKNIKNRLNMKKTIKLTENDLHNLINESVKNVLNERRKLPNPKKWNIDGVEYEETNNIKGGGAWHPGFRFKDHESHLPERLKRYRKRKDGYRYAQEYAGHPHNLHRNLTIESKMLKENYDEKNAYNMGTHFLEMTNMSAEELLSEIISWMGDWDAMEWLEDMYNMHDIENPWNEEEIENEEDFEEDEY